MREQLKKEALEVMYEIGNMTEWQLATTNTLKIMVDLISRQDAFIDSQADTIKRMEVEASRWRELCLQNAKLDNRASIPDLENM